MQAFTFESMADWAECIPGEGLTLFGQDLCLGFKWGRWVCLAFGEGLKALGAVVLLDLAPRAL